MRKRTLSNKYGHLSHPAYTRREYIKKGPQDKKVAKFTSGTPGAYSLELDLIPIRDGFLIEHVLEAIRVSFGHALKDLPYILRIVPYPHWIVREHAMLGIAKAERFQKGMRLSFGKKCIGRSACIKKEEPIVKLWIHDKDLEAAKKAMKIAKCKIPIHCRVEIKKATDIPAYAGKEKVEVKKPEPIAKPIPKEVRKE